MLVSLQNRWEHLHVYFSWLKGGEKIDDDINNPIRQSAIHQRGGFDFHDMLPASTWEH